jgi:hypothetical protein
MDNVVDMRNVDSAGSSYSWPATAKVDADHTAMDEFCMTCHDSDGADDIAVNTAGDGLDRGPGATNAMTPFNPTDNLRDATTNTGSFNLPAGYERGGVIDVKSQFSSTIANHQVPVAGVAGEKKYTSHNTNWGDAAWVTTKVLKNGTQLGGGSGVYEAASLHCADCHTVDTNAHNGGNVFMLTGTNVTNTCYQCHNSAEYTNRVPAGASRFAHGACDHAMDNGTEADFGNSHCLKCHGGDSNDAPYGGIHGIPPSYGNAALSGEPHYRFMGGQLANFVPVNANEGTTVDWVNSGGDYRCYFQPASLDWSGCNRHQNENFYLSDRANDPDNDAQWTRQLNY